jgi:Spy/CpxP family protein refolding chaperone
MNRRLSSRFRNCSNKRVWWLAALIFSLAGAPAAWAQLPREFYAWWNSPIARDLNLTGQQQQQIRQVIREYRPHLTELRNTINKTETELQGLLDSEPVDSRKANEAIDRLAAAHSDLTRSLSHMSLQLRSLLTQSQWQELQKRFREQKADAQAPASQPSQDLERKPDPYQKK